MSNMHARFLVALIALCATKESFAFTGMVDGIEWSYTVWNGEASVGTSSATAVPKTTSGAITIPSTLGGYPVTTIGSGAFLSLTNLTSVVIPDSVISIGSYAFRDCDKLASITIPGSVASIGSRAFFSCNGLANVIISGGVKDIGEDAFSACPFTSVTIPSSVTNIGSYAFFYCSGLTSVTIPDSVTSIGLYAFDNCPRIASVTIPQYVCSQQLSTIFPHSYQSITNIVISDSVRSIRSNAFSGCNGLESVTVPQYVCSQRLSSIFPDSYGTIKSVVIADGVTNVGSLCYGCKNLTSVTIPDSVTSIGSSAFSSCSKLTSVTIPSSVTSIGASAFYDCIGLASVVIPNSVTSIGASAFYGCSGLKDVMVPQSVLDSQIRNVFSSSRSSITNIAYSSVITNIGSYAFSGCSGLTSVTIPDSVTSIGDNAFSSCSGLTSVTIPDSVTSIGSSAFYNCSGLASVAIPNSVTSIGASAFYGCNGLTTVYLSDNYTGPTDVFPSNAAILRYKHNQTVYFDANGGSVSQESTAVLFGRPYGELPVPSRIECEFMGWALSGDIIDSETMVSELDDHTLIAQWKANQYVMTFNANGGTGGKSVTLDYGSSLSAPTVTRTGYTFKGWSPSVPSTVPAENATYTAQWQINRYTMTFNANGGVGGKTVIQDYGSPLSAPTVTPPTVTREGYTFTGWSPSVPSTVPAGNATYRAQWQVNRYSITFDANGGVGGKTVSGNYGSWLSAPTVTRTGYTFVGWSPSVPSAVPAENATYTAQWQINQYTMTFDANGGVGGKTIVLDYGSPLSAPAVTREGHTFNGWSPGVPSTVPDGDATYTAQWLVNKYTVTFNANGGTCGTAELSIDYGTSVGELPVPVRDNAVFLGWFTEAEGGVKVDADTVVTGELVLYAHWLFEVESPVVVASEGNPFRAESCEVSIECATEGAAIYYTDDGTTPRLNDDYLYTGPFTITDTTVIKAIAVFQELRSGYVTTTIEKHTLTFEEALGSVEGVAFATGGDALWSPIVYDAAKRGDICAKSGAIGNRAETWLSATVEGAGAMTFWCKTSCEHDEDNMFTWDRLMIYTNGVEIAEWRMDGETDWTERALSFEGGVNTVKWVYYKDRTGADGEDCAWIDAMTWTPSAAADPIPTVTVDADAATVNAAVDGVGFADTAVKAAIGGSATEYDAFKTWADGVKGTAGDALAGEAAVVANEHAAAAYLLGSERLFENEPTIEIGGLAIAEGESAGTTAMTVAVTVKDGERAVAVTAAKVAAMFEATGDLGDWNGVAKLTPTVTTSGTDASGKMIFVVTPGDGTAAKAFLRIRK